jgi:hypothetical protein
MMKQVMASVLLLALSVKAQTCYTESSDFCGVSVGNLKSDFDILYGTAEKKLTKYHTLSQVNYCVQTDAFGEAYGPLVSI